jgi:carboxylesterase type B
MTELGSPHAGEIPLVFGTYQTDMLGGILCGDGPEAEACSWDMMDRWVGFASWDRASLPGGPKGFPTEGKALVFGESSGSVVPGSVFKTAEEKKVWQGFMEKVELNYNLITSKM